MASSFPTIPDPGCDFLREIQPLQGAQDRVVTGADWLVVVLVHFNVQMRPT